MMTVTPSIPVYPCPNQFHNLSLLPSSSVSLVLYHLPPKTSRCLPIQLQPRTPQAVFSPSDPDYCAVLLSEVCSTWLRIGTSAIVWILPSLSIPSSTYLLTYLIELYLPPSCTYQLFHWRCKQGVWIFTSSISNSPGTFSYSLSCCFPGSFTVAPLCYLSNMSL